MHNFFNDQIVPSYKVNERLPYIHEKIDVFTASNV